MAKARSPGYPTIGLREAIAKIEGVYKKDYQNRIGRALVAEHMGYRSLNGKSLGVLSAVAKFGLLEGRGDENRVSDLALDIIAHSKGTPERAHAIVTAASRPELFAELDAKFQGGKASDAAIRSYLITKKFIPPAADMALRAYRETKDLVHDEAAGYSAEGLPQTEPEEADMPSPAAESSSATRPIPSMTATPVMQAGEREFLRGPLSKEASYRLLVSGEIGTRELGKIIKLLTLQRELLSEEDEESDERPS